MFKRFFQSALILSAVPALFGAAGFDDKVRADFFAGFAGDSAALQRGMAAAEKAIATEPGSAAEALSWHGSGILVMSGEKFRQGQMGPAMELWQRAISEMDEAGQRAPDNPAVLIPRASAWFGASRGTPPEMAKPILKKALADFEHVYDIQRAYFDKLDIHMRSELLFGLADGYNRDGDPVKARGWFEKLAAVGPEGGHYKQAKQYLDGEKYTVSALGCVGCHTGR